MSTSYNFCRDLPISEDLSRPIAKKQPWKKYNTRMSTWARGTLAKALESTTKQRKASHVLVNAAYTSQMDSNTHLLEGKREGDKFYCANGDVLQADFNAALNLLHRYSDQEITLYTPHREVRRILLARSSGATECQGGMSCKRPESLINRVRISLTTLSNYAQVFRSSS